MSHPGPRCPCCSVAESKRGCIRGFQCECRNKDQAMGAHLWIEICCRRIPTGRRVKGQPEMTMCNKCAVHCKCPEGLLTADESIAIIRAKGKF